MSVSTFSFVPKTQACVWGDGGICAAILKQALEAKHFKNWETLFRKIADGYSSINPKNSQKVLERLKAVEKRGRYKEKY